MSASRLALPAWTRLFASVRGGVLLLALLILMPAAWGSEVWIPEGGFRLSVGDQVSRMVFPLRARSIDTLAPAGETDTFERSRRTLLNLPTPGQALWLELSLQNPGALREVVLGFDRPVTAHGNAWLIEAGKAPAALTMIRSPFLATRLIIPAHGRVRVLMEVTASSAQPVQWLLEDLSHFEERQASQMGQTGLQTGALAFLGCTLLLFAFRIRDIACLQAALLGLLLTAGLALAEGLPPPESVLSPLDRHHLLILLATLYLVLETGFLLGFLDMREHFPRAARYLDVLRASSVLMLLPWWSGRTDHAENLLLTLVALTLPVTLTITWLRWQAGFVPARWLLMSRLCMSALCIAIPLASATGMTIPIAILSHLSWWLTAQMLLVLPALLDRRVLQLDDAGNTVQRIALAEAETRVKTEFLSKLSHEIRTPMNGILGMAELLEETPLTPMQLDYIRTITSSGRNLLNVIDDFMDYTNIESGNLALDITILDLPSTVKECMDIFRLRAEEKSLELVSLIQSDVPTQVKGDPLRIRQALANLVSNAVKFTDKGDVMITVSVDREVSDHNVRFEVRDTGPGIPKEDLRHLLEEGARPVSNGLGLAVTRQLVKMMGGQMGASSEPGGGSIFWFSLPLEALPEAPESAPFFAGQLQGLRMLVVDDNASCRLVMQQQATSWGMQVSTAINGKQALALSRSQANLGEPFDIIIVDHDMPGMSGLELAAKLKEDALINPNLLVLMLTGQNIAPTATASRNAGIRRVLTKPVTGRILKITLTEELGHLKKIAGNSKPPGPEDITELSELQVLVAEDHPLSQKVITGMLAKLEVHATLVVNGREALQEAKSGRYHLILMDCDMPEMDGFEATRRIRQWETMHRRNETPIIALTAHIMDEHKERSLACGMNAHLSKPVELAELRDTMLRWARWARDPKRSS